MVDGGTGAVDGGGTWAAGCDCGGAIVDDPDVIGPNVPVFALPWIVSGGSTRNINSH